MNKKGFTIIEVLVAIFLSGLVLATLVGLWVSAINFNSSAKQELLFKNMFSLAEKKIHRDISEASSVQTGGGECTGGARFLTIFKNYLWEESLCPAGATYSVIGYCLVGAVIYRTERTVDCAEQPPACVCQTNEVIMRDVTGAPVAQIENISMVRVRFNAATTLGRAARPLNLDFNKSFAFMGTE